MSSVRLKGLSSRADSSRWGSGPKNAGEVFTHAWSDDSGGVACDDEPDVKDAKHDCFVILRDSLQTDLHQFYVQDM